MDDERVVCRETNPQNDLKLVASGAIDEMMPEVFEDYVRRRKQLFRAHQQLFPDHQ